ncbi:MAG: heme-binding protein [Actinomycetia bacterium]|nr:heme-binding protein [Actinomycetes bacterium]
MIKRNNGTGARRRLAGLAAGCLLGGFAIGAVAAPSAAADTDCSPDAVANTVATTMSSARSYLAAHPDADEVLTPALNNPGPQSASTVREYFTAHPVQYLQLRGILAPIGETQQQCNVAVLPPDKASAYAQFMAG